MLYREIMAVCSEIRTKHINTLCGQNVGLFLAAFAKLRRATLSFVMSVHPSAWNNSVPAGRIFIKFHMSIFRKSVEKIQVSLISDKNNV
jgi:hypothetical protein